MNPILGSGITVGEALQWAQLIISAITLLGGVFMLGRIFERMGTMQKNQAETKVALFGRDGQGGIFLPRTEAELLFQNANTRIDEYGRRISALEHREPA